MLSVTIVERLDFKNETGEFQHDMPRLCRALKVVWQTQGPIV